MVNNYIFKSLDLKSREKFLEMLALKLKNELYQRFETGFVTEEREKSNKSIF